MEHQRGSAWALTAEAMSRTAISTKVFMCVVALMIARGIAIVVAGEKKKGKSGSLTPSPPHGRRPRAGDPGLKGGYVQDDTAIFCGRTKSGRTNGSGIPP